jgi:DNA polymerase III subunit gamma/tau
MENFIVSARKYRPATFDTVVGQQPITQTLKNAIKSEHLAQAFLFCGPRGVGKTTCARILAKTINCQNLTPNIEACNECESCKSFNNSASFNVYELDAASNNSVDDIRNLVDQVRIPPQVGKYKIYIIDEVHMLSQAAFNAFLKTLEEPPAYAKFILATTEKHKIIPTILSRCQIFDFRRIRLEDIASHLAYVASKENIMADTDALHIIAQKAEGGLRDALSMFDQLVSFAGNHLSYDLVIQNLNVLDYDYYFRLIDYFLTGDASNTLLLYDEVMEKGFDGQHFLIGLGEHLRNLLVCRDEVTLKLLETGENIRERYKAQAQQCKPDFLLKALEINNRCDVNYKSSNNKRLSIEIALLQITALLQNPEVSQEGKPQLAKPTTTTAGVTHAIPATPTTQPTSKPTQTAANSPVSSAQPPKTVSGMPPGMPTHSSTSIKKMIDTSSDNPQEEKKNEPESTASRVITQDEIEMHWNEFASGFKQTNSSMFVTLSGRKPILKENDKIEFEVVSKIQETEIRDRKTELLDFLKQKTQNYRLSVEIIVTEIIKDAKPYTPDDKFKAMAEINPLLSRFRQELNLELDF